MITKETIAEKAFSAACAKLREMDVTPSPNDIQDEKRSEFMEKLYKEVYKVKYHYELTPAQKRNVHDIADKMFPRIPNSD